MCVMARSKYVTFDDLVRFHREVIGPDLDARFGRVEGAIRASSDRTDTRFDSVDTRFGMVARQLGVLSDHIDAVEQKANERHDAILANFTEVYGRILWLAKEFEPVNLGLRRVEARVTKLEKARL